MENQDGCTLNFIEIVGAKINNKIITNDIREIINAANNGELIEPLAREHMKFMSACDLGKNWDDMANGETLFYQNKNGDLQWNL